LNEAKPWYERPLDRRAHAGSEEGLNGREYKGGEFMPFYVPRPVMPQIAQSDLDALIHFTRQRQIWVQRYVAKSTMLIHHQRVYWDPKRWDPKLANTPVLVASDFFILDGNHRAFANRKHRLESHIIQFGLPFEPAIDLLFSFPKTTSGQT
jgi:hypothetical protein